MDGIYFPGLGIGFENVPKGFEIFGVFIPLYAIVVTTGFFLALLIAEREAKRTSQDPDVYLDFFLVLVIPAILGARIYYILFNLDNFIISGDSFKDTVIRMINIRNGGLAIYGGLIAGTIAGAIFAKKRKLSFPLFADTIAMGVLVGQILGRWGNFFNREAFGGYSGGLFRMAIPYDYYGEIFKNYMRREGIVDHDILTHMELVNGVQCITVHPTFLYEGLWNLAVLIFIFLYRKKKKFDGELAMIYVMMYGIGRMMVEALRTDSLMIGPIKVSQLVGLICFLVGLVVLIYNYRRIKDE